MPYYYLEVLIVISSKKLIAIIILIIELNITNPTSTLTLIFTIKKRLIKNCNKKTVTVAQPHILEGVHPPPYLLGLNHSNLLNSFIIFLVNISNTILEFNELVKY